MRLYCLLWEESTLVLAHCGLVYKVDIATCPELRYKSLYYYKTTLQPLYVYTASMQHCLLGVIYLCWILFVIEVQFSFFKFAKTHFSHKVRFYCLLWEVSTVVLAHCNLTGLK